MYGRYVNGSEYKFLIKLQESQINLNPCGSGSNTVVSFVVFRISFDFPLPDLNPHGQYRSWRLKIGKSGATLIYICSHSLFLKTFLWPTRVR
jgi:hypothetical protein